MRDATPPSDVPAEPLALGDELRLLRMAERMGNTGHWHWDLGADHVIWSDETWRIHGLEPQPMGPNLNDALAFYVESDRPQVEDAIRVTLETGAALTFTAQIRRADGRLRTVRSWGEATLCPTGCVRAVSGVFRDVTEKVEALARATRAEQQLHAAIEALPDGFILCDRDDRLVLWNRRYAELYPHAAPILRPGVPFADILRSSLAAGHHAAARGREEAWLAERLAGHARDLHICEQHGPGDTWLRIVESRTPGGDHVGLRIDITELKRQQHEIDSARARAETAEAKLSQAIEALPDGFVLYDPDDRLLMWNSRYAELYPHAAPHMRRGMPFIEVLHHGLAAGHYVEARGREEAWLAERLAGHARDLNICEQQSPGDRWVRVVETRTPAGDHVGLRVDITDHKRQQRELEDARCRAEAASRAKSSFLANMSHEIRTPMNGVIGMAQALAPLLPPGRARDMLAVIEESGETLMTIINDLLDFSKIEAGRMTVEQTALSLAELSRRIELNHMLRAADRGLAFQVTLDPDLHADRLGDPTRVQQILHNLVGNAIKFTETGSVALEIAPAGPGDLVRFRVRDTGIGMTADQAREVFGEFTQADTSTTRRFGGTGLGLSIVKGLVSAMGGTLDVTSEPGRGTIFDIVLPLPPAPVEPGDRHAPQAAAPVPRGLRILAAEDNRVNRLVLMSSLDALEAQVTMTEDGPACLAALARGGFDLALIDISMPGMDGSEVIRAHRAREAALGVPRLPALAVTANAMTHQIQDYLAAGFDGHVAKPIRRPDLEARISALIQASARTG